MRIYIVSYDAVRTTVPGAILGLLCERRGVADAATGLERRLDTSLLYGI